MRVRQGILEILFAEKRTNKVSGHAVACCVQQPHEAASIPDSLLEPKNLFLRSSTAVVWQRLIFFVASFLVRGRCREDQ